MQSKLAECPVMVPTEIAVGSYANAFRIVQDSGTEWFLDFLAFSDSEQCAVVTARVRVQEAFLQAVRDRLSTVLVEISDARSAPAPMGVVSMVPGKTIN